MNPELDLALYVNGEKIPAALVLDEASKLRGLPCFQQIPDADDREAQVILAAEAGAIDRILVKQVAEKDKEPLLPEELEAEYQKLRASGNCRPGTSPQALIGRLEMQVRFARAIRKLVGPRNALPDGAAESHFNSQRAQFFIPERVEVSHLVKHVGQGLTGEEALEHILAAQAELDRGEDFAAVVSLYSDCPSESGRIPPFARGEMVSEFEDAVFGLECGSRSTVFRTPFGFHIAKMHSKHAPRELGFEEVKGEIERMLGATMEQQSLRRALDRLRETALITRGAPGA